MGYRLTDGFSWASEFNAEWICDFHEQLIDLFIDYWEQLPLRKNKTKNISPLHVQVYIKDGWYTHHLKHVVTIIPETIEKSWDIMQETIKHANNINAFIKEFKSFI